MTFFPLAVFIQAVVARNIIGEMWSTDQDPALANYDPSNPDRDMLFSPDYQCQIFANSTVLTYRHPFINEFYYSCPGAVSFKPTSYGQIRIATTTGKDCYIGKQGLPLGNYGIVMGNDCNIHIYNGNGQKMYTMGMDVTNYLWAYQKVTGQSSWTNPWDLPQPNVANPVTVLSLDSFTNDNKDFGAHGYQIYGTILDWTAESTFHFNHFPLTSNYSSTTFTETDFVTAMKSGVLNNYNNLNPTVINFSGAFRNQSSTVANCAIQWAYYSGLVVVTAAGNSNANLTQRNPFQFVVGSVDYDRYGAPALGKVWSSSSFGKALDIWAPVSFRAPFIKNGTSISTAIVTSAFVTALNKWGIYLNKNPGRAMKYISSLARTDFLSASDPKVVASPYAGTKFLSTRNINVTVPATGSYLPTTVPDYCSSIGLPTRFTFDSDWDKLKALSNPNNIGDLVSSMNNGYQYCGSSVNYGMTSLFCR